MLSVRIELSLRWEFTGLHYRNHVDASLDIGDHNMLMMELKVGLTVEWGNAQPAGQPVFCVFLQRLIVPG